jgi:hypothetical protein
VVKINEKKYNIVISSRLIRKLKLKATRVVYGFAEVRTLLLR